MALQYSMAESLSTPITVVVTEPAADKDKRPPEQRHDDVHQQMMRRPGAEVFPDVGIQQHRGQHPGADEYVNSNQPGKHISSLTDPLTYSAIMDTWV
jgi:hypothetical protein